MPDTVNFCFFLVDDITTENVEAVRALIENLAQCKLWTWGPPEFFDESDDSSCTQSGDEPIRNVGGVVSIAQASVGGADDRRALEHVEAVIEKVCKLSSERRLEFELQLGPEYVGSIYSGIPDRSVREGLLAPWRAALKERHHGM